MAHNRHDTLFRVLLNQPAHAPGALYVVAPSVLEAVLDWSTLTLQPRTFVDAAVRLQHSDLLFSAVRYDGGEVLILFLFEHPSSPESFTDFRLLTYYISVLGWWRDEHPKGMTLPKIIPILMYRGGEYWSQPRAFDGLIDAPGSLGSGERYPIRLMHVLDDVSEVSSDVLRDTATIAALSKLVAMCFKRAPTRTALLQILGRWIAVMQEVAAAPNGLESLRRVIIYILQVNEYVEPEALKAHLEREIVLQVKDAIATAGQRLIEQGRQESRQAFQKSLLHLLRQRFGGEVDVHVEQRVTAASVEQLQSWIARVLSVSTLTELFAD